VSGTIYSPDGKQPLEGITLFVYQTDATGVYTTSGGDNRGTRIHGVMRTNAQGNMNSAPLSPALTRTAATPLTFTPMFPVRAIPNTGSMNISSATIRSFATRTSEKRAVREASRPS
jgi:hypothetical protein